MKKHTFASGAVVIEVAGQWYRVENGRVEHFGGGWTIRREPVSDEVAQSVRAMVAVAQETNPDLAPQRPRISMYAAGMFIGFFSGPGVGFLEYDELEQIMSLDRGERVQIGTVTYEAEG